MFTTDLQSLMVFVIFDLETFNDFLTFSSVLLTNKLNLLFIFIGTEIFGTMRASAKKGSSFSTWNEIANFFWKSIRIFQETTEKRLTEPLRKNKSFEEHLSSTTLLMERTFQEFSSTTLIVFCCLLMAIIANPWVIKFHLLSDLWYNLTLVLLSIYKLRVRKHQGNLQTKFTL